MEEEKSLEEIQSSPEPDIAMPPETSEEEEGGPVKPFLEHLEDLRWVIFKCLGAFIVAFIICVSFTPSLIDILELPMKKGLPEGAEVAIAQFEVTAPFTVVLQIGIWGGLCLAFPFLLYFIGDYIVPALHRSEKKYLGVAFTAGVVLFSMGALMAYFLVAPISLKAFYSLGEWLGIPPVAWTAKSYFGFIPKLILGMGFAFEVPIVVLTLVKLNVVSAEFLVTGRKYMLIGNLVLSAFITPQDLVSTVMLAAPLQILFEICIIIARYWDKQEKKKLKEMGFDV